MRWEKLFGMSREGERKGANYQVPGVKKGGSEWVIEQGAEGLR